MKNILVTGGAGFIGSHLCERLLKEKKHVLCIDNFDDYYAREIKEKNLSKVIESNEFEFFEVDIRTYKSLDNELKEQEIDCIVHLAARPGVQSSINDPQSTFTHNIVGTQNILEFCRRQKIPELVFASSSSVYGNQVSGPFKEDYETSYPESPYAASKKSCEVMIYAYSTMFNIAASCLRFFTVYGPRQRPEMAIHHFTKMAHEEEILKVFGPSDTSRDYTYIDDAIECIYRAINKVEGFEIINVGGGQPILLGALINAILITTESHCEIEWLPGRKGDVQFTHADTTKLEKYLGYVPKIRIDEGIPKFVEWYEEQFIDIDRQG